MPDGLLLSLSGTGDRYEFGIPDPIRADGCDFDPPREELDAKGPGEAVQERLGRRVDIQVLKRLEGCGGLDLHDPASAFHIREAQIGQVNGGFAVQVDHPPAFLNAD